MEHVVNELIAKGRDLLGQIEGSAAHEALDVARREFRKTLAWATEELKQAQESPKVVAFAEPETVEVPKIPEGTKPGTVVKAVTAFALGLLLLLSPRAQAQSASAAPPVNNAASATVGPAGTLTNPSGLQVAVSPGPVFCNGATSVVHNTLFNLTASTGPYFVYYNCAQDNIAVNLTPPPMAITVMFGTVTCGATTCATFVDLRSATFFPNVADETYFIPETACGGGVTGTVGTGNATDIVALSGGVRVFRLSNTAAGASNNTFTCTFSIPTKLTAGKGFIPTDFTFLVSTQTTQPTSVVLPTVKIFNIPAAVDPETANSATFTSFCGTITQAPSSAQFAAYTAVAAGQFFSVKATCGTPTIMNTDLQMIQVVFQFNQSAAAAGVQETPGLIVHGSRVVM